MELLGIAAAGYSVSFDKLGATGAAWATVEAALVRRPVPIKVDRSGVDRFIGDEAQSMFADNQEAFDSKGRKFSADSKASIYDGSSDVLWKEINPDNKVKGKVYFDIPEGAPSSPSSSCTTQCSRAVSASVSDGPQWGMPRGPPSGTPHVQVLAVEVR